MRLDGITLKSIIHADLELSIEIEAIVGRPKDIRIKLYHTGKLISIFTMDKWFDVMKTVDKEIQKVLKAYEVLSSPE